MRGNVPQRWILFKQESEKFPYLLCIEEKPNEFLCLAVQDRWPGPNKKIYCLIEERHSAADFPQEEPLESCSIVKLARHGKKLNIILDRKTKRRCWFLFLKKEYKTKPGEFYDQVFWITQSSAIVRRPGAYIPRVREGGGLEIIIDKRERYAYKFGYARTIRENLPVGDYAVKKDQKIIAVAERKTLDDFLHQIGVYDVFKVKLQELSTYPNKAVIFEAPYSNFLDPKRIKPYSASYVADILADLVVLFPEIQFVFCENRKFAQEWLLRWFLRINAEDIM